MSRGGRGRGAVGSAIVQAYRNLSRDGPLSQRLEDNELYPALTSGLQAPVQTQAMLHKLQLKRKLEKRLQGSIGKVKPNTKFFPSELNWRRTATAAAAAKRQAAAQLSEIHVQQEQQQLDEDVEDHAEAPAAAAAAGTAAAAAEKKNNSDSDPDSEQEPDEAFDNDEELEDNDYVDTYFDNGEGYGADDGEEDMDGESWFY